MSQSSRPDPHALLSLDELISACQQERSVFYATGASQSPACIALFSRAFAGDQAAWSAVYALFDAQVRAWVGKQQLIDSEDAVQDAWRSFARSAPQHPNLLAADDLSPLLGYLRTCAKSAVLMLVRAMRAQRRQATWSLAAEPDAAADDAQADHSPSAPSYDAPVSLESARALAGEQRLAEDVEQRALYANVLSRAGALMETDQERIILHCRLKLWLTPRDVLALYPDSFQDIREVRTIVQRITRRLSQDPIIRTLLER
jgi:hypothetical protein